MRHAEALNLSWFHVFHEDDIIQILEFLKFMLLVSGGILFQQMVCISLGTNFFQLLVVYSYET